MALRLMVMAGRFNLGAADFLHSSCLHPVVNILGYDLVHRARGSVDRALV